MPRILAIDWDRLEARALLLQSGATGTSILGAWAVPLSSDDGATPTGKQIGQSLSAELAGQSTSGAITIVGVGREQVQMKLLSLPPAPPEELPELVRFQAEREFTSLGSEAALDFIPLVGDATTPYQVLAAALTGEGVREVREICEALGVEPDRITLRATAAASFVARRTAGNRIEVLLVANRLTDEADLTALVGEQVVLVRTVRISDPSDAAGRTRTLAGEIRRTVAAVRQQSSEQQVGRVVLCGHASETDVASSMAAELGLAVEVFDVSAQAPAGFTTVKLSTESTSRFAAALGMALGEADRRAPVLDFLNIRRRVTERRFSRLHALAAAAVAFLVLALGVQFWRQSTEPARELREVNAELASLDNQNKQYAKVTKQAGQIDRWLATDVNWLDELDRFSRQWRPTPLDSKEYPAAEDAVVTQLTVKRPPSLNATGGILDLKAAAKSPAAIAAVETRLRDANHRVATGSVKQDRTVPGYERSFDLSMDVTPSIESQGAAP